MQNSVIQCNCANHSNLYYARSEVIYYARSEVIYGWEILFAGDTFRARINCRLWCTVLYLRVRIVYTGTGLRLRLRLWLRATAMATATCWAYFIYLDDVLY